MAAQFRLAVAGEIPAILCIIERSRDLLRAGGNMQWDESYPAQKHIAADIANGCGYVMVEAGHVLAYGAIIFEGEPAYASLEGQWLSQAPYVVVHRLAVSPEARGRGVASDFLAFAEQLALSRGVKSFKIDTSPANAAMKHILSESGFSYCGNICFQGITLLAYEKLLG